MSPLAQHKDKFDLCDAPDPGGRWEAIKVRADRLGPNCFDMIYDTHASAESMRRMRSDYRPLGLVLHSMERDLDEREARVNRHNERQTVK